MSKEEQKLDLNLDSRAKSPKTKRGCYFTLGRILLFLLFVWIVAGVVVVEPTERVLVSRFGKYQDTLEPGIHWIPRFVDHANFVDVEHNQVLNYQAELFSADKVLILLKARIEYRIVDPNSYLFSVTDPVKTIEADVANVIYQVVSTSSLDDLISQSAINKMVLQARVAEQLVADLLNYQCGCKIVAISLELLPPSDAPTASAFQKALHMGTVKKKGMADVLVYKDKVLIQAKEQSDATLVAARAYKQQVLEQAKSNLAEYLSVLSVYKKAPEITKWQLYSSFLESVRNNNKVVVVDAHGGSGSSITLDRAVLDPLANAKINPATSSEVSAKIKKMEEAPRFSPSHLRQDVPDRVGYPKIGEQR
ncbi:MAG: SPFH domain-containing protein [Gammaproteobacteria bacterium]|jgi:membrane protease subunit HflK